MACFSGNGAGLYGSQAFAARHVGPFSMRLAASASVDLDGKDGRRQALRLLVQAFVDATGRAFSAVGRTVAADSSFFARLDQHAPTRRKYDLVVAQFSKNWPDNAI